MTEYCEVCGEELTAGNRSKSYRHRCKKCVAELTKERRREAKQKKNNLKNSNMKQLIKLQGRNIKDVFKLDCCKKIVKSEFDGKPIFTIETKRGTENAYIGDILIQNDDESWSIKSKQP